MDNIGLMARITYNPEIFGGKPIIRASRFHHFYWILNAALNDHTLVLDKRFGVNKYKRVIGLAEIFLRLALYYEI